MKNANVTSDLPAIEKNLSTRNAHRELTTDDRSRSHIVCTGKTQQREISRVKTAGMVWVIFACMKSMDVGVYSEEVSRFMCVCLFVHVKPEGVLVPGYSVCSFFDCLCVWDASVPCRLNSVVCFARVGLYGRRVLLRVSPLNTNKQTRCRHVNEKVTDKRCNVGVASR